MSICSLTRCWRRWAAVAAAAVAAVIYAAATVIAASATGRLPYDSVKPLLNTTITKICRGMRSTRGSPEKCTLWTPLKFHGLSSSNIVPYLPYYTRTILRTRVINTRWPILPPFYRLDNWRITVSASIGAGRWSTGWRWSEWHWPA